MPRPCRTECHTTEALIRELAAGHGVALSEAAASLPAGRRNRPVSVSCLNRWADRGVLASDGTVVRLETARLGGRRLTSTAALARFIARQNPLPVSR